LVALIQLVFGVLLVMGGLRLDQAESLAPACLALWIHAAAGIGALLFIGTRDPARWRTASVAAYCGWRISFFPVLVLSGHTAAICEWGLWQLELTRWVYPTLLLCMAAGISIAPRLVYAVFESRSKRRRMGWLLTLVPALLISFTGPDDLHLLPDRTPWTNPPVPVAQLPERNVYRHALQDGTVRILQRPLLVAAATTYRTIPDSPWAARVQGTLEAAFTARKIGSSTHRVEEHFQAFCAAQSALNR